MLISERISAIQAGSKYPNKARFRNFLQSLNQVVVSQKALWLGCIEIIIVHVSS